MTALLGLALAGSTVAADVSYTDVAAIFTERCVICHSGPAAPRGLRLDSLEAVLAGGDRGPVVNSGDSAGSEMIRRLNGSSMPRMPMTGPPFLSAEEISRIEAWIDAGTPAGEGPAPGAAVAANLGTGRDSSEPGDADVTFDKVAPIFATRCAKCHTDDGKMGAPPEGYRLTSYASILSRSDRVRVVPGNPAASELLRRIRGQSLPRMPFDGPPFLGKAEIALIERWIAAGAPDAAGAPAAVPTGARVRLRSTLTERWRLDDLPLDVNSRTRIRKNPQPGDVVRVRGEVRADGSIRIERIRRD